MSATRQLQATHGLLALCLSAAACAYDLGEHPSACAETSDCAPGHTCDTGFCVLQDVGAANVDGSVSAPGRVGGAGADGDGGDGVGDQDGAVGDLGASDASDSDLKDGGAIGGGATDAGPVADAALVDATMGGPSSGPDAGTDAGPAPVAPYSACAGDQDCNSGDTCRTNGARGSCGAPCTTDGECPTIPGSFTAIPVCDAAGYGRICCAAMGVPPLPRSCPAGTGCATDSLGVQTCYPN